jgi:hypothetical protein
MNKQKQNNQPNKPFGGPQKQNNQPNKPFGGPQKQNNQPNKPFGGPQNQNNPPFRPGGPQNQNNPPFRPGGPQNQNNPPFRPGGPQNQNNPPFRPGGPQNQNNPPFRPGGGPSDMNIFNRTGGVQNFMQTNFNQNIVRGNGQQLQKSGTNISLESNEVRYYFIMYLLSILCQSINKQYLYNGIQLIFDKLIIQKNALEKDEITEFENIIETNINKGEDYDEIELPIEPGKRLANKIKIQGSEEENKVLFIELTQQEKDMILNIKKSDFQIFNQLTILLDFMKTKSKKYLISYISQIENAISIIKKVSSRWSSLSSNMKKFMRDCVSTFCIMKETPFMYETQIISLLTNAKGIIETFKSDTSYEHVNTMMQQIKKPNTNIGQVFLFLCLEMAEMISKNKNNATQYNKACDLAILYIDITTDVFRIFKESTNIENISQIGDQTENNNFEKKSEVILTNNTENTPLSRNSISRNSEF